MDRRIQRLMSDMIEYDAGDPRRIQHFIKVHDLAAAIGIGEGLDEETLFILESAAVLHDIGIHNAERRYHSSAGKYQELEGPGEARDLIERLNRSGTGEEVYTPEEIQRICYLIGHHHTYTGIDGPDYQILVEADFLVNLYEDGSPLRACRAAGERIFRTATGRKYLKDMFLTVPEARNLALNLTGMFHEEEMKKHGITVVDLSDIPGTDMYLSDDARDEIRKRLTPYGPSGIHFLEGGNYHYLTEFFLEKIHGPYSLVLFDNHSDMQLPMIHKMTSCGSWAGEVLFRDENLVQLILVGPDEATMDAIDVRDRAESAGKMVCISLQDLQQEKAAQKIETVNTDVPMYISVDKDVLSRQYAVTNWNQGQMSLPTLEKLLRKIYLDCDVIGTDICGEYRPSDGPLPEYARAERINAGTDQELYNFIMRQIGRSLSN